MQEDYDSKSRAITMYARHLNRISPIDFSMNPEDIGKQLLREIEYFEKNYNPQYKDNVILIKPYLR